MKQRRRDGPGFGITCVPVVRTIMYMLFAWLFARVSCWIKLSVLFGIASDNCDSLPFASAPLDLKGCCGESRERASWIGSSMSRI